MERNKPVVSGAGRLMMALGGTACLLLLAIALGATEQAPGGKKTTKTLENLKGLRVQVLVSDPMAGFTTAAGFWLNSEGVIVTCWRNLSQNPDGVIQIKSSAIAGQPLPGSLLTQDIQRNLALIKAEPNPFARAGEKLNALNLRLQAAVPAPNLPKVGDKVYVAVATSARLNFAAQERTVAEVRAVNELAGEQKILVSGVTRFGFAGEPVVDAAGRVVGILEGPYPSMDRAKWGTTEVVIPIQTALDLIKSKSTKTPPGR